MQDLKNVALVIPAYNEAATIRGLAERALAQCDHLIIVNDASQDETADQLQGLPVTLLENDENLGKAGSLWRGMLYAMEIGAEQIVTLDGDGQHHPEDIPRLLNAARLHPGQIVIAARDMSGTHVPVGRKRANRIANFWISWAAGYPIEDSQSGFRVYPAELIRQLRIDVARERSFVFESEVLIEAAARGVKSVPVVIDAIYEPGQRASHFRPVLDIVRITRMVAWKLIRQGMAPMGLLRSLGVLPVRGSRVSASQ
jgi:glycosyltransferase involved in cell wall biosynthesis